MANSTIAYAIYQLALMQVKDRGAKLVYKKDSKFWRNLEKFVAAITPNKHLNEGTTTTYGKTIYLADGFDDLPYEQRAETIAHELVHVEQFKRMTWVGFMFVYVFVFFPIALAYGRYWLERQAYLTGYKVFLSALPEEEKPFWKEDLPKEFAEYMASGTYYWGWPFKKSSRKWMANQLKDL